MERLRVIFFSERDEFVLRDRAGAQLNDIARLEILEVEDIARMFPRRHVENLLRPLAVVRVPFAQFAQPPGAFQRLPGNETAIAGLIVAGDGTLSSSIQGAMLSGQRAADAALHAIDTGALTPV